MKYIYSSWLARPLAALGLLLATAGTARAQTPTATFAPVAAYSTGTGSNPYSIAAADVNGDGRLDLLTSNYSSSTAGVLLGNGNGTFGAVTTYSTGTNSNPYSIAVADVNGDGKRDLLTANHNSKTAGVLLGNGNGTFGAATTYSTGDYTYNIAVGDVNGDGKLDLLTAGYSNVGVLLGNGNGTFGAVTNYSTGTGITIPYGIVVADVNGDGKLDLLTAISNLNTAGVLLGNGNGTFGAVTNYSTGGNSPADIAVADVNGDGNLDLLVPNLSSNKAGVLLGNGNGTFGAATNYSTGSNPNGIAVADVNGDGKLDLLTSNYSSSTAGVLLNTTVFAPTLTSLNRTSGLVGTSITLTGNTLSGATSVSFNGTAATTFTVVNNTTITATVPAGATSGSVTVTTPGGTSNGLAFTVVTAAPTVTGPASNSTTNGLPTFTGTAPAGSTVTLYLAMGSGTAQAIGTTPATGGSFSFTPTTALASGTYSVYATAQSSGQAVSAQSNTNPFTVDATAPTVTLSSTVANNGATTSTPVSFTAQFSEGVGTSFSASDVTVSGGTVGNFAAGSAANSYTFTVAPAVGTVRVSIAAGVVQDAVGNGNLASATYTFTYALPTTAAPTVTAPAASSTTNGLPTYAGTAPTGSTVTIYLAMGSGAAQAIGTTTATGGGFSFTPTTALASGTYSVYATAQLSGQNVSARSNTNLFTVDATAPTVVASTRQNPTAATTNATALTFRVTFSESVTGVNATDFTLTTTAGTVTSSGRTVTAVSGSVYDVTVSGVSGNGTVRLDLNASNTSIVDAVGNPIGGGYTSGQPYTLDQMAPVASISRQNPTATVTNATAVTFRVTFSESVTGVSTGSFTLNTTGTAAGTLASVTTVSSSSYDLVVSGVSGNGTLGLTLKSTGSGVTDGAGNAPSGATGPTYTLDQTAPTVTSLTSTAGTSGSTTSTTPFSFTATFSEPVTGFAASDLAVSNGTVSSGPTAGSGNSFTFQVTPTTPGTATTVQVRAGVVQDQAGNGNLASGTYALTFQAPTLTVSPTNGTLTSGTQGTAYSVTFTASGGSGSYTYGLSGNLPAGLTFAGSTLAGTPTASGTFGFRLTATDNSAAPGPYSGFRDYTLTIGALPLTATVSTTSASPTSTAPIPFAVSFSQSVGTTFVASDVTVTGGTVTSGSFSGSGAGPYAFTVTPTGAGTVTVSVAAGVANDANNTGNSASNAVSVQYQLPTTTAPIVTSPANGSTVNGLPTYAGTAPAGSTVTIYLAVGSGAAQAIGTTTATGGNFSLTPTTALTSGSYQVYATAQASGSTVSANSNTNAFTVDATQPTVTLSSPNGTSGSTSSTTPLAFTATFSEPVTGFSASGITVTNGTLSSGPTAGSGNTYTFSVMPTTAGTATSVTVAANAAQDAVGNGNTASATYSLTYVAPVTLLTWNGSVDQDWNTPANWTPVQVPTAGTDVLIPGAGVRFYPIVPATGAATRTLTLVGPGTLTQSAGTLTVTGNLTSSGAITKSAGTLAVTGELSNTGTLTQSGGDITVASSLTNSSSGTISQTAGTVTVNGNLTNNGAFATGGGTVLLGGGATASNIFGSAAIRFWNLTIQASGAQLSTSAGASVRRVLTLTGNFATNANLFTLESTSTGDALVVNSGGVVTGTVTVQRYINPSLNPGPGYRHYASPVSNSTVADLTTSGFTPTINPAYNSSATPTAVSPFPTVYGYDDSRLSLANNLVPFDKGYFSPAALSDPLAVGRGYTVNLAASELVDFQGPLNNDVLTLLLTSTRATYPEGGWQLLGNPYPAPLDYSRVAAADRPGLEGAIYVYQSTSQYAGQYRSYINGIGNPVLPLGQGFFARVAAGLSTATMTFRNSQRLTQPTGTTFQRTTAEPRPLVQLTLQGVGSPLLDEATVYFENGATGGFDPSYDAQKLPNVTGLNLSTNLASGQPLSIDGQPELGTSQRTIPLTVGVPTAGAYALAASQLLNLSTVPVYLRDHQSGALIDLAQQLTYQFTVSNATTLVTGRFELVFAPQQVLATVPAALAQQVSVYPNPAKEQVAIELPLSLSRQPVTATLVDALGRVVRTQVLPAGLATHTLPLTDLATGVYALRLRTEAGLLVRKLVVD